MNETQQENTLLDALLSPGAAVCIVRRVLRRWYLIVTMALIAAMAAFIFADLRYTPQYTTSTTFVVTGSSFSTTYQNLNAANDAANVFTEILNSSLLRQKITEETGITGFDGSISASVVSATNLLNVQVRGSDPRTVYLVTRAMIDHHRIVSAEVLGATVLEVLQEPAIPTAPSNIKNTARLVKLAMALAAAATTLLLGLRAWQADTLRSRDEADRKLRCRILGELYHERRHRTLTQVLTRQKTGILITRPLTSFGYAEAIHKLTSRIDRLRRKGERVIMVTSLLENEGKSTVAVNLALSWARKGRRVLLVDCDLRRPACHRLLNVSAGSGMPQLLNGESTLKKESISILHGSLHLIRGGQGITNAATLLTGPALEQILCRAAEEYDLVVVDTPPMGLMPDAEYIGAAAHCALVVARQDTADASDVDQMIHALEGTGTHMLGCILNNVYGHTGFAPAFRQGSHRYGYGSYGSYGYGRKHTHSEEADG